MENEPTKDASDGRDERSDDGAAGRSSDGVRIDAVEAAVAAGLVPSASRRPAAGGEPARVPPVPPLELPDWGDPPTGQVPRILLDDEDANDETPIVRGPTWREDRSDWEQDLDLSFLVAGEDDDEAVPAPEDRQADEDPFNFSFEDLAPPSRFADATREAPVTEAVPTVEADDGLADAAWASLLQPGTASALRNVEPRAKRRERRARRSLRPGGRRREDPPATEASALPGEPGATWFRRDRKPRRRAAEPAAATSPPSPAGRNPLVATATGIVAGGVAIACFLAGPIPSLVLVATLVTLAAGEAFSAMRRAHLAPLTPLGLCAVPLLVVVAYLRGTQAVVITFAAAVLLAAAIAVADGARRDDAPSPVARLGATTFVIGWVGLAASFAGLLIAPSLYPHRHGLALVVGAVLLNVASDIGAYAIGARFGRHLLAPRVSPHKSWEGFAGGSVLTLLVAALIVARIHPFSLAHALLLGVIVCVVAPIGDLVESLVKRDLKIKDMGSLLPAHGGVLDRVDGLLVVLPVTYFLAHLVHLA